MFRRATEASRSNTAFPRLGGPIAILCGGALLGLALLATPGRAQSCLVTTPIGPGHDLGTTVAIQADGKIVQAGYISNGSDDDFVVVRYTSNFTLDPSFDVDGVVVTPIGAGQDQAEALAIQSDGKIVVAGFSHNGANNDFAIVRYNPDGSLDTSFNGTGMVVTPIGTGHDEIEGVVIQPDGKIVVTGLTNSGSDNYAVARYNSNGSLDTTGFNSGGLQRSPAGHRHQPDRGCRLHKRHRPSG